MAPTTPFNINPSLWLLWNSMGDEGAAGAVAVATAAKKKQEKKAMRGLKTGKKREAWRCLLSASTVRWQKLQRRMPSTRVEWT
jgi:hypothetical protein